MSSFILIASQTLTSASASVTFSSIPTTANGKTLRDLVLVISGRASVGTVRPYVRINGDTGNNYARVEMLSRPSGNFSSAGLQSYFDAGFFDTSQRGFATAQLLNFAQTNMHKSILVRSGYADNATSDGEIVASVTRWTNTAAITSLLVYIFGGAEFAVGSTISLYGIEG
jgi:hypothetical protein